MYNTDKDYWHQYIPEYERVVFSSFKRQPRILEVGVFTGESIRLLHNRFPESKITGIDIIKDKGDWLIHPNISYKVADQGDPVAVRNLFKEVGYQDLIIDDGSHMPSHQAITLKEGIMWVAHNGWYIVEDVHTAPLDLKASPLVLFLALYHLRQLNKQLDTTLLNQLQSKNFSSADILLINDLVKEIHVYRRAVLPKRCFRCGSTMINYGMLACGNCRENMYLPYDSMTLMLKI